MMRLIDADQLNSHIVLFNGNFHRMVLVDDINRLAESRKGEWIYPYGDKHYKRCSFCGQEHYHIPWKAKFCPFCGARMEGDQDADL